uniref:C3H1-type domain-containing protein n=1 Tax=Globodera pallida TaxID=36090 RepID=A0A183CPV7_GLOPA
MLKMSGQRFWKPGRHLQHQFFLHRLAKPARQLKAHPKHFKKDRRTPPTQASVPSPRASPPLKAKRARSKRKKSKRSATPETSTVVNELLNAPSRPPKVYDVPNKLTANTYRKGRAADPDWWLNTKQKKRSKKQRKRDLERLRHKNDSDAAQLNQTAGPSLASIPSLLSTPIGMDICSPQKSPPPRPPHPIPPPPPLLQQPPPPPPQLVESVPMPSELFMVCGRFYFRNLEQRPVTDFRLHFFVIDCFHLFTYGNCAFRKRCKFSHGDFEQTIGWLDAWRQFKAMEESLRSPMARASKSPTASPTARSSKSHTAYSRHSNSPTARLSRSKSPTARTSTTPTGTATTRYGTLLSKLQMELPLVIIFTTTLLTSIGYGNLVPISPLGRLFCYFLRSLRHSADSDTPSPMWPNFLRCVHNGVPTFYQLIKNSNFDQFRSPDPNSKDMILWGGEWLEDGLRTLCKGGQSAEETERRREREWRRREQHEEGEQFLRVPGPYTKAFVLSLLLIYMLSMAVLFSRLQHGWNLLDSLYFTLITMVTIGFGDFCPPANTEPSDSEPNHYGGWILFIIVGLTLSTLTVDLVGSAYIEP